MKAKMTKEQVLKIRHEKRMKLMEVIVDERVAAVEIIMLLEDIRYRLDKLASVQSNAPSKDASDKNTGW